MSEQYTGKAQDRRYKGTDVDITYSLKRCIHAAECVNHLRSVWDKDKRPWINPDGAPVAEVAAVIELCPSGALHYERKDGGAAETAPSENRIILWRNGPIQIEGDLALQGATVAIEQETRVTLCRCGASANKPFCDNHHEQIQFEATPPSVVKVEADAASGGKLTITVNPNGPLGIEGNMQLINETGEVIFTGSKTWLCRCGGSQKKPFCDSTHKQSGFAAE
jgi:CDGSH-type Zn-finger protein/uncharacterized Fe-S cluster protein YjdI